MVTETENSASKNQFEAYFFTEEDGTVRPLDPVTGELLQPDSPPKSLLADERLREGYDFLKSCGDRLRFTLLLSAHGSYEDTKKAGIDLHAEAETLSKNGGVLFFEGPGTQDDRTKQEYQYSYVAAVSAEQAPQAATILRAEAQKSNGGEGFLLNNLAEIAGTKVQTAAPDYLKDSDRPADQTLFNWRRAIGAAILRPDNNEALDTWSSLEVGFVAYRDWYLVGKMGEALSKLDKQGVLPEVIQSALLAGSHHANIGRHMEKFGAEVAYKGEYGESLRDPYSDQIVRSAGSMALDTEARIELLAGGLHKQAEIAQK